MQCHATVLSTEAIYTKLQGLCERGKSYDSIFSGVSSLKQAACREELTASPKSCANMAKKDKPIEFRYDTMSGIGQADFDPSSRARAGASEQVSFVRIEFALELQHQSCECYLWKIVIWTLQNGP